MINFFIIAAFMLIFVFVGLKCEASDSGMFYDKTWKSYSDHESLALKGTKMVENDSNSDLYKKLETILSYHERTVLWRRSFIISVFLISFVYMVHKMNDKFDTPDQYFMLWFLFSGILYFYFNFVIYHHHRLLKENGTEIINKLRDTCNN